MAGSHQHLPSGREARRTLKICGLAQRARHLGDAALQLLVVLRRDWPTPVATSRGSLPAENWRVFEFWFFWGFGFFEF